jgi:hypothetical protein
MEAMQTRFNAVTRQINDLVTGGITGQVTSVRADFSIAAAYDPAHRLWNPGLADGALLDPGVYPIAFGSMLLGTPDLIRALTTPVRTGVDANTAIIARYPGGAVGLYQYGLWADSPSLWVPEIVTAYATWAYSRIRPPIRSRHRTRMPVTSVGGCPAQRAGSSAPTGCFPSWKMRVPRGAPLLPLLPPRRGSAGSTHRR